jgi:PAS domain S-box-containing protein/putative nucleotidyltransferase with HDIG domain
VRIDQFISGSAVDRLVEVLLLVGPEGRIVDANPAALECYGYSLDEMRSLSVRDIRAVSARAAIDAQLSEAMEHGVAFETEYRRSDGSTFPAEVRSASVSVDGETALLSIVRDLTDRQRAVEALRDSEEQCRTITENITDVVWTMDPRTMMFSYVSPSVEGLLGFTPAEMKSRSVTAAMTPESANEMSGLIEERAERFASGTEPEDRSYSEEVEQPCKDGSTVWTEVVTRFHRNTASGEVEVLGVTRDISERKKAEDRLGVFAELLEASPAAVTVHTPDGGFVYANERAVEMHGYTREEFLALNLREVDVPESAQLIQERIHQIAEHGEASFEVAHFRKDGSILPLAVNARIASWDGRPVILSIATDITQRKELEAVQREMVTSVIDVLGSVSEMRDPYTAGHQRRVAQIASEIAREMGMSDQDITEIRMAGLMHDVGKMAIPAEILAKPTALSEMEYALIKAHSEAGYNIIRSAHMQGPIAEFVCQHHERCDGSGYPSGLTGDQLLVGSKVLMVADVVEAMMSHRPYRAALGQEAALAEIERGAGTLYDVDVADACLRVFRERGFALAAA